MRLKIFMKSGNVLLINFVKHYTFRYNGDDIVFLNIEFKKIRWGTKVLIPSINLSQIEAISKC